MLKNFAPLLSLMALMPLMAPPSASASGIYSCVTTSGQNVTSDRPIPNCRDSAQRVLNRDGSTRDTLRAEPTIAERQDALNRERAAARERDQAELNRQQVQNWLSRYPDAATLDAERSTNLLPYRRMLDDAQTRLNSINSKRLTLQAQADGQKKAGRSVAPHLAASIELQASMAASQSVVVENQQLEMRRVNKRYDDLLARLRPFWSGPAANPAASAPTAAPPAPVSPPPPPATPPR